MNDDSKWKATKMKGKDLRTGIVPAGTPRKTGNTFESDSFQVLSLVFEEMRLETRAQGEEKRGDRHMTGNESAVGCLHDTR